MAVKLGRYSCTMDKRHACALVFPEWECDIFFDMEITESYHVGDSVSFPLQALFWIWFQVYIIF